MFLILLIVSDIIAFTTIEWNNILVRIKKLNLFTFHKLLLYIFLLLVTNRIFDFTTFNSGLSIAFITVMAFFVQHRINDLLKSVGILNGFMNNFVNYHEDSIDKATGQAKSGRCKFSLKIGKETSSEHLYSYTSDLIKITIWHNELIQFTHIVRLWHVSTMVLRDLEERRIEQERNALINQANVENQRVEEQEELILTNETIIRQKENHDLYLKNLEKSPLDFTNNSYSISTAKLKHNFNLFKELFSSF